MHASAESGEDRPWGRGSPSMAGEETGRGRSPGQVNDSHTACALPAARDCHLR